MTEAIYWVKSRSPGRLAIIPRPRGGDWLKDDLLVLKHTGFTTLVSLLSPYEEESLGLLEEGRAAQAVGLVFVALPIADRDVPEWKFFGRFTWR